MPVLVVVVVPGVVVVAMLVPRMVVLSVIVAMASGPVRVTVLELFLRRGAYVDDLDVEHERLAGERVVQIEVDVEVPDLHGTRWIPFGSCAP